MLNSKELYSKISVWREEKGWTENKLCDMAGVSHSMFHSWVSRGTMPKLDTLESLCYALNKPLAALLFDVDENKLTGEEIQLLSRWKQVFRWHRPTSAGISVLQEVTRLQRLKISHRIEMF